MAELSLTRLTKVRALTEGSTLSKLVPVEELPPKFKVVDWYGQEHEATVSTPEDKPRRIFRTINGEALAFGEDHTVYCRAKGDARWKRRFVADINEDFYVRMPQRKLSIDDAVAEALDGDNTGIFLAPKNPAQILPLLEASATAGLLSQREKTVLKIIIERHRPSCFAAKLINGNFSTDLEEALSGLASTAIIQPHGPFNTAFVEKCKAYDTVFEGSSLYNDLKLFPLAGKEAKAPCYTITVDDDVPVETPWFCT